MRNGIVFRKDNKNSFLFYVPIEMEKNVIFKYRDDFGHAGIEKTFEIIKKNYYYPDMKKKITVHVQNCCKCIAYNPPYGKKEGEINVIPKGDKPFETLHTDHLSIIDKRVTSKKYILVIIDSFSKFVNLYAIKSLSSSETIACLKNYFSFHIYCI